MNSTRRKLLERTFYGAGALGLRAAATGLPLALFTRPLTAWGQGGACMNPAQAKHVILSTGNAGCPLNANVPGTYAFDDIAHADHPSMVGTDFKLGAQTVRGAQIWSTLPQWVLDRTAFLHHATLTNNHGNLAKVLAVMGSTVKQEMWPSLLAQHLAPCLGTVQTEPVSVGAGELLTFAGRALPNLPPTGLRDVLSKPKTPIAALQSVRDQTVDKMWAYVKENGTPGHRAFIDSMVMSRRQARQLGDDLLGMLAGITGDNVAGMILGTVVLIRMNVSPVLAIRIPFGGDNHTDVDLLPGEVKQHETGVAAFALLQETLRQYGLQDRVLFVAQNVFGRTLKKLGRAGRDHWASHHATVMIGSTVRPGVVGGLEPRGGDYYATPIDAKTGRAAPGGGDIPFNESLAAVAKTIARAAGVPRAAVDTQIAGGKVIDAALTI